jgi:hypothetical protein
VHLRLRQPFAASKPRCQDIYNTRTPLLDTLFGSKPIPGLSWSMIYSHVACLGIVRRVQSSPAGHVHMGGKTTVRGGEKAGAKGEERGARLADFARPAEDFFFFFWRSVRARALLTGIIIIIIYQPARRSQLQYGAPRGQKLLVKPTGTLLSGCGKVGVVPFPLPPPPPLSPKPLLCSASGRSHQSDDVLLFSAFFRITAGQSCSYVMSHVVRGLRRTVKGDEGERQKKAATAI